MVSKQNKIEIAWNAFFLRNGIENVDGFGWEVSNTFATAQTEVDLYLSRIAGLFCDGLILSSGGHGLKLVGVANVCFWLGLWTEPCLCFPSDLWWGSLPAAA